MAEQETHEEPSLKVSDRRHFTETGERRAGVDSVPFEEAAPPPPKSAAPPPPAAATAGKAAGREAVRQPPPPPPPSPAPRERLAAREITFVGLLQDLYATAMLQLGAELQPGRPPQVDLEGARETIDLLGMLQDKTRGNLDAQEQRLLDMALHELHLAYVEVKQASGRVQPAVAVPPMPPPGGRRR